MNKKLIATQAKAHPPLMDYPFDNISSADVYSSIETLRSLIVKIGYGKTSSLALNHIIHTRDQFYLRFGKHIDPSNTTVILFSETIAKLTTDEAYQFFDYTIEDLSNMRLKNLRDDLRELFKLPRLSDQEITHKLKNPGAHSSLLH